MLAVAVTAAVVTIVELFHNGKHSIANFNYGKAFNMR
jgi:hypothetical protein